MAESQAFSQPHEPFPVLIVGPGPAFSVEVTAHTRCISGSTIGAHGLFVACSLAALGASVVHVGEAGAGHTAKLVNQLICGLAIEAVGEGLTLAEKAGLDPTLVQKALVAGLPTRRSSSSTALG